MGSAPHERFDYRETRLKIIRSDIATLQGAKEGDDENRVSPVHIPREEDESVEENHVDAADDTAEVNDSPLSPLDAPGGDSMDVDASGDAVNVIEPFWLTGHTSHMTCSHRLQVHGTLRERETCSS